ncbi:MAG TPA: hypothetical protein PKV80_11990 [Leptospiraceae bacterium]|nr:hypothetical protein [Leptospiraceae bacterium]
MREEEYLSVRKKIRERELLDSNLDDAEKELLSLSEKYPSEGRIYGILSEIYYWRGEYSLGDKLEIYEKGAAYGEKGVKLSPGSVEANFWLGVNYGFLGLEKGMLQSYMLLDPIEKHFKKAVEIDETFFHGAPHRSFGWFFHQIPPWPISKGDNKKAIDHLKKSLKFGPEFPLTHLYIGQVFLAVKDWKNARYHLEWTVNREGNPLYLKEEARYKDLASSLLKKL